MSEPTPKLMTVAPGFYTMLRSFLRDHEQEYGEETASMAFAHLGVPEQPKGTSVRVIVDWEASEDFVLINDPSPPQPIKGITQDEQ